MVILRPRTWLSSDLSSVEQVAAAIVDDARRLAVGGEQAHRRHHGLALAGAGFADDGDGFAGIDVEVDALDRLDHAVERAEADAKVLDRRGSVSAVPIVSGPSGRARRAGRRR